MDVKKYNIKDLTLAYFNKKSQIYRSGGYKQARVLTRDKEDYINHFFAFLIDINICLLPVYIWVIEFLLILCGLISSHFFDLLFYIMYGCLFVVAVLLLGLFTARSKGQSFGYVLTDLKLVRRDKREAMALNLDHASGFRYWDSFDDLRLFLWNAGNFGMVVVKWNYRIDYTKSTVFI